MSAATSPSLATSPTVDCWLDFTEPGVVRAATGKSELGQGISTALAQVVADALGVAVGRVRMRPPSTQGGPDEGFTAGSLSIQHSGTALDAAARTARALFERAACESLGVSEVTIEDGSFVGEGRAVTYWELAAGVGLSVAVDPGAPQPSSAGIVGSAVARRDLEGKVLGRPSYLHDLRLPHLAYGRVLRPPYRGATLAALDEAALAGEPSLLASVVDGSFVGVVARTEIGARRALELARAAATWTGAPTSLANEQVVDFLVAAPADVTPVASPAAGTPAGDTQELRARYTRPFLAHASIGPSAAAAMWAGDALRVWSHTQGVYPLRNDIARALELPPESVVVEHVEGAGCYGHNGADDVAYDAALLARAVPGVPVHVTWSREDELGWSPFGPAMVVDIAARHRPDGTIVSWSWDGYSNGHSGRPATLATPSLLAYADQRQGSPIPPSGDPPPAAGHGTARNAVPIYSVGSVSATAHTVSEMPVRSSALRSLGAHLNVFAIECHIDDLARRCRADPLAYRLRHLADPRARAVLERVADMCDWAQRPAGDSYGRGLGFARYKGTGAWCAVVVDIEAQERIRLERMWIAVDVGRAVNPDGIVNQIEGGAVQAASWTLLEQVRFAEGRVISDTWEEYPILRFSDVPPIEVAVMDRPDQPWLGAGEASMGPTAAAIGNALADATGIRARRLPLTPEAIVAAMEEGPEGTY
ncbi:MAG: xanthine dehydrogenase family protein molybdopterin-binding subunit [Candidatus Nanopelagicales bacterium]